jgi:hypothetical protein
MGVTAFGPWFRNHCRLKRLDLSHNELGNEEAHQLGLDLGYMNTLEAFFLRGNNIKATGARNIVHVLPFNETLTELDLSENPLYDDGARLICKSLASSQALRTLHLAGCNITHFALEPLLKALRKNHRLLELDMAGNAIDDRDLNSIDGYISSNNHLVQLATSPEDFVFDPKDRRNSILLDKVHHLDIGVIMRLRDHNATVDSVQNIKEKLVALAPYTRKELLQQAEAAKRRRKMRVSQGKISAFRFLKAPVETAKQEPEKEKPKDASTEEESIESSK